MMADYHVKNFFFFRLIEHGDFRVCVRSLRPGCPGGRLNAGEICERSTRVVPSLSTACMTELGQTRSPCLHALVKLVNYSKP